MRFRIKEQCLVTQWSYVTADSKEEALNKIEKNRKFYIYLSEEIEDESEWKHTDWDTLEEVDKEVVE